MTHHTDAERAEFEAWARGYGTWEVKRDDDVVLGTTGYTDITLTVAWHAVQAAHRAPAAPVPLRKPTVAQVTDAIGYHASAWDCVGPRELIDAILMLAAAPQPPEAAPVPQFSRIAQKKLDHLLEAGEAITGYAIENKDGRRGAIDCHGFVYWWQDAAAPQPPEAQASVSNGTLAAPVQLPEPQAEIEVRSMKTYLDLSIHEWRDTLPDGAYNIYTEQQVRDLLAAHGIQERST